MVEEIQEELRDVLAEEMPNMEEQLKKLVLQILTEKQMELKSLAQRFKDEIHLNKVEVDALLAQEQERDKVYRQWLSYAKKENFTGGHLEQAKKAAELKKELDAFEDFERYILQRNENMKSEKISVLFQEFYSKIFKYQNELNKMITGDSIKMIGVYRSPNGKTIELYEIEEENLINYIVPSLASGKLNVKTGLSSQESFRKVGKQLINNNFKFNLTGLNETATEIYQRYNYSKSKLVKASIGYVLWKPNGRWLGIKIATLGDVDEAYTLFYLKNEANPSFSKDRENNIDDFIRQGIQSVDSAAGILQGDIVGENGQQYQVKGIGSSLGNTGKLFDLFDSLAGINSSNLEESASKIVELLMPGDKRNQIIDYISKDVSVDFKNAEKDLADLKKDANSRSHIITM